jgi:hypothetical protein
VLLASSLKLFGTSTTVTVAVLAGLLVLAGPIWMLLRRAHGFPALPSRERQEQAAATAAG